MAALFAIRQLKQRRDSEIQIGNTLIIRSFLNPLNRIAANYILMIDNLPSKQNNLHLQMMMKFQI